MAGALTGPPRPAGGPPRRTAGPPRRTGRPPGGSELKRTAIVHAALQLFVRDGFDRTSVDAIAAEAGVSKRTIYNHYGDKERLFLAVVSDTFESLVGALVELMDIYLTDLPDDAVEDGIIAFSREAALFAARSPDRPSVIRLMISEAPHFPALMELQRRTPGGIVSSIAKRLERLGARGLLEVPDPLEAASHLFSLTMGQFNNRSIWGAIKLPDDEVAQMATSGARAFLRAYRPR